MKISFWLPRLEIQAETTVPHALKQTEPAVERLRLCADFIRNGQGPLSQTHRFIPSDLFKVMEGAAYSLALHPDPELETRIVKMKVPGIQDTLVKQLVDAIVKIREMDLKKKPSISETLDWAQSLIALQVGDLTTEVVVDTLNVICKYRADTDLVKQSIAKIV